MKYSEELSVPIRQALFDEALEEIEFLLNEDDFQYFVKVYGTTRIQAYNHCANVRKRLQARRNSILLKCLVRIRV